MSQFHLPASRQPGATHSFGAQLRLFRERAGLSREALAERAGLGVATLAALERDQRRRPHPHTLVTLAEALALTEAERNALLERARTSPAMVSPTEVPSMPSGRVAQQLPSQLNPLVGRTQALADVAHLLQTARLVTLIGAGGVGKTRLALAAAAAEVAQPVPPDGVWLVSLAPLIDQTLVPYAVANAVGIPEQPLRPLLEAIIEAVSTQRGLLVLDNCEHLIQACAELAQALLGGCPDLRILATSREPLGLAGEVTWRVPSLRLPPQPSPPAEQLAQYEAVRLFVERATAARPDFRLTDARAAAVADICWRVDGIPLALELAAAWVRTLSVEQLAARLDNRLGLLVGGSRTAPPRQQTLRGAIEWSYDLLTEPERRLFVSLSILAGGWTLETAEAVCAGEEIRAVDVLGLLRQLVDKSLVVVDETPGGTRYRLLEAVQEYAAELLAGDAAAAAIEDRLMDWTTAFGELAGAGLVSAGEGEWLGRVGRELPVLRVALKRLAARGDTARGARLASCLGPYWVCRGPMAEGRRWLQTFLDGEPHALPSNLRALATIWACRLAVEEGDPTAVEQLEAAYYAMRRTQVGMSEWLQATEHLAYGLTMRGDLDRADALTAEGIEAARSAHQPFWLATFLQRRALSAQRHGQDELAITRAQEAVELARSLGYDRVAAWSEQILARLETPGTGEASAVRALLANLAAHRAAGDGRGVVGALGSLGAICGADDYAVAARWYREGIQEAQHIGYWLGEVYCAAGVAAAAVDGERFENALRLHTALMPHQRQLKAGIPAHFYAAYCATMARAAERCGDGVLPVYERASWPVVREQALALADELGQPQQRLPFSIGRHGAAAVSKSQPR